MKLSVLSLILSLFVSAYCANIKANEAEAEIYITQKCSRNAHNDVALSELMNAASNFPICLETAVGGGLPPSPVMEYTQYCQAVGEGGYYKCLEDLGKKITPCLDPDEVYFPNFVLSLFNATLAEFCGENGFKKISEILKDVETNSCVTDTKSLETIQDRCLENTILYKNYELSVFTIKKNDLCSDLQSVKGCIKQVLEEQCNKDYSNSLDYLFESTLAPCV